jgi:hypothetical protein
MLKTLLWIGGLAALTCWSIGAYNRLVRLRAAAKETHKALQNMLLQKQEAIISQSPDVHLDVKVQMSMDALDSAIQHYNQAIKQFPASLIAALFGFKPYMHSIDKSE